MTSPARATGRNRTHRRAPPATPRTGSPRAHPRAGTLGLGLGISTALTIGMIAAPRPVVAPLIAWPDISLAAAHATSTPAPRRNAETLNARRPAGTDWAPPPRRVDAAFDSFPSWSRRPAPSPIPRSASGSFRVAPGKVTESGTGARLTYTVEVERGLPFSPEAVARRVDQTLTHPRGWEAASPYRLDRTDGDADLRILVASPDTTDRLCAPLNTGGRLSCRNQDAVVLNARRWRNGAMAYGSNLRDYRRYLVNHEVGHALGHPHADCPGPGKPAPVMMQQTLGLGGCDPNPWPTPHP